MLAGTIAALLILGAFLSTSIPGTTSKLYADVTQAIRTAKTVVVSINTIDESGGLTTAKILYAPQEGFRVEASDKIVIDNGALQWSWDPRATLPATIVSRRRSQDGMSMISEMLQLETLPVEWRQSRAPELDREVQGQKLDAYLIEERESSTSDASKSNASRQRIYVWRDSQQRVIDIQSQQTRDDSSWREVRSINITYDQELDSKQFTYADIQNATIVDIDKLWEQRFPLEKALAIGEDGGLKFAVHEVSRCGTDMFYIVSSVRATEDLLKKSSIKRRRLNLQTTLWDVAEHLNGASVQQDYHLATLSTAEFEGVHYMWWIAAQRRYFRIKDGERIPEYAGTKLEFEPGKLRLPIMANYRDRQLGNGLAIAKLDVPLSKEIESLADVSRRVRRDLTLSPEILNIYKFEGQSLHPVAISEVTDEAFASSLQSEIEWLRSHDQLGEERLGQTGLGNDQ
jgi:hypothetical protein